MNAYVQRFTFTVNDDSYQGFARYESLSTEPSVWIELEIPAKEKPTSILVHCNNRLPRFEDYAHLSPKDLLKVAIQRIGMPCVKPLVINQLGRDKTLLLRFNEPKLESYLLEHEDLS